MRAQPAASSPDLAGAGHRRRLRRNTTDSGGRLCQTWIVIGEPQRMSTASGCSPVCWWTAFAGYVAGGLALARLLGLPACPGVDGHPCYGRLAAARRLGSGSEPAGRLGSTAVAAMCSGGHLKSPRSALLSTRRPSVAELPANGQQNLAGQVEHGFALFGSRPFARGNPGCGFSAQVRRSTNRAEAFN